VYRHDIPLILRRNLVPILVVVLTQVAAYAVGLEYADLYPFPSGLVDLTVPDDAFQNLPDVGILPSISVLPIMLHNLRVLALAALLGLFSFGTMAVVLMLIPMAIIGFFAGQAPMVGATAGLLLATFILPHGFVELPTVIVATGLALRLGAVVIAPPSGMTVTQGILLALADLIKVFVFLVLPLLCVSAMLEVWLTPWIVTRVW
jgi:stage II sporulation protein M